jgi:hypothetical protein
MLRRKKWNEVFSIFLETFRGPVDRQEVPTSSMERYRGDEMYGFVPALMFGGPDTRDHLEKVKAVEHLTLLSQIAELQAYSFSDL